MRKFFLPTLFIGIFFVFPLFIARAIMTDQECRQNIDRCLEETNNLKQSLEADLTNKESDYQSLTTKLNQIKSRLVVLENEIAKKEQEVKEGERALKYQETLLAERVNSYYKNVNRGSLDLMSLLVTQNLSDSLRDFFYQRSIVDKDRDTIIKVVLYIKNLEEIKKNLEGEKNQLSVLRQEVDVQSQALAGQISETREQIAQLSARQQQLVAQRLASLNIPRSAGTSTRGCTDDRSVVPGFSPRLAFFTFGAPHRNGLNQYGAKGRADAGQNVEQILSEYYPNMSLKKDYDQGAQVNVDGHGTFNIEDYTKRIYEVPADWPMETLKAQAVAARTYALNSMQRNGHICTTEACQVFKPEEKGGRWNEAVEATKGWVMMDGGNPGFTQYASTHGGYILNLGKFDGNGGHGSFSDVQSDAYDRESPWFYCDWGARGGYSNTAWLKPPEVADIVNVILLARADSSTGDHLYQTDKGHPYGGEVWNEERIKQELRNRSITPFNNVYDVSVSADFNSGKTSSISLSGDGRSESFSGDEFKNWFNLRAPANIQIVGPLFNVEKQ